MVIGLGDRASLRTSDENQPYSSTCILLTPISQQEALYQRLASEYGKDNVRTEQPSDVGTLIDIVMKMKNEY